MGDGGMTKVYNMDCMEAMRETPDKFYELALVDPPYGISQPAFRSESKNKAAKTTKYNDSVFKQSAPNEIYFNELSRISKNQIIWGGNYYCSFLPAGKQWIFWDKGTEKTQWGDGELAYTSFVGSVVKFDFTWNGMIQQDMKNKEFRIHPTQKPVALYKWLLHNYAKEGDKILDTHLGSGSSRIAAYQMGFDFTGYEIDKDYFDAAEKRFKLVSSQTTMNL